MDRVLEALKNNGFPAKFFKNRDSVRKWLLAELKRFKTIGVGGSVTIRDIGILEELKREGKVVLDHWEKGLSKEETVSIRRKHLICDAFLTSVNALTKDGILVSMDGIGNRVAAMIFGPRKVFVVAGRNKIVEDIHGAVRRIRDVAAPRNAERFGFKDLPCVNVGRCVDCNHPDRICRALVIIEKKPMLTDIVVCLVDEELGY